MSTHDDISLLACIGSANWRKVFDDTNVNVKPYRDAFFPIGLTDPAAFHQVLANLALYLRRVRNSPKSEDYETQEALVHQMKALQLVNKKIADPGESTSDGVIGAIISLACVTVSYFQDKVGHPTCMLLT